MRILVLRFSSLGDVVLASAPVRALAAMYPGAEIMMATKRDYAPLFHGFPHPLSLKPYDPSLSVAEYVATLGDPAFDLVIDLHGSLRSRAVTRRLRPRELRRVNKRTLQRWRMVWSKKGLDQPLSALDSYLELVSSDRDEFRPRLYLDSQEQSNSDNHHSDGTIRLGIGWGARHPTKTVPEGLWSRLLNVLKERGNLALAFFGISEDAPAIQKFIHSGLFSGEQMIADAHIDRPLREVMVAIAACDVFVSSDSGLMHVADALGIPTFGLFGPTHPALGFAPSGHKSRAFHAGTWCSPCHRHGSAPCFRERRYCFDDLDIEAIAAAVLASLNEIPTPNQTR